jgi:anti-anti-sigma factor
VNPELYAAVARYNDSHPELTLGVSVVGNGQYVVTVSGSLDIETSTQVKPLLDDIVKHIPVAGHLTLDLEHVGYISSTGVGLLTTLLSQTRKELIGFSLTRVQNPVIKVMELLGFSSFIDLEALDA